MLCLSRRGGPGIRRTGERASGAGSALWMGGGRSPGAGWGVATEEWRVRACGREGGGVYRRMERRRSLGVLEACLMFEREREGKREEP